MTNKEAIEKIQSIKSKVSLYDDVVALRMAENALEKQKSLEEELEKIKAEIKMYENDCMLACPNNDDCRDCNDNMFGSIYRIIDKHIKEIKEWNW